MVRRLTPGSEDLEQYPVVCGAKRLTVPLQGGPRRASVPRQPRTSPVVKLLPVPVEAHPAGTDPVVNLGGSSVDLSLRAWCADSSTAKAVEYDLLEQIKKRFDEVGIEIPYAYQNVIVSGAISARAEGESASPSGGQMKR